MRYTISIQSANQRVSVSCDEAETLLSALLSAGVSGVESPCGGSGRCRKCGVIVSGAVCSLETGRVRSAAGEELLACRYAPAGDCLVSVKAREAMRVVTAGAGPIGVAGAGLGAAVDIGTTTVAAFLYDLAEGRRLCAAGERNAQRGYGADVISRITACAAGKLPALRDAVREQIAALIGRLCREAGRDPAGIKRISIAGNTVMEHLFDGLDPSGIGVAPFTPQSLFGDWRSSRLCLPGLDAAAEVYLCPCLTGYVGGDITAGLMAAGADRAESLWLYVDIGTNGEMALGDRNGFLTCATAAGPAFEGAEIVCGMEAAAGAIDRVWAENGGVRVHVIGEGKARGLCGSGLIDAAAALLELGAIDETGRLAEAGELPWPLNERLFTLPDGSRAFRLQDPVYLAARDIRQVQLAKAAIRAGADTLLSRRGKTTEEIDALVIAGGFGSFLDKKSALRVGLIPPVAPERIRHVGNAAGAGAALALAPGGERRLQALAERCESIELSASGEFMERYIERMTFDEEGTRQ